MRAGVASGRARSRRSSTKRSTTSANAEQRDPDRQVHRLRQLRRDEQHAEPARSAPASARRRRRSRAGRVAPAPDRAARRACSQRRRRSSRVRRHQRQRRQRRCGDARGPDPVGSVVPGSASANGRVVRSAASTHADSRDSRVSVSSCVRQSRPVERDRTAAAGAFERLREPSGAARDGFPRDALQRIAALVFAQAGEIGVVAAARRARIDALFAGRQRRRMRFRRRIRDARSAENARKPSRATGRADATTTA